MNHLRQRHIRTVTALAALACAGTADADTILSYPNFGIVNGAEIARINAVLAIPPEPDMTCPATLSFINGKTVTEEFPLKDSAVHKDFLGDPSERLGTRLTTRVEITWGDPNLFPACAPGVLTSVEVIDRKTLATRFILTNPVRRETTLAQ
ncbi:MAG: hypothetical protein ACREA0_18405 [bacterium]